MNHTSKYAREHDTNVTVSQPLSPLYNLSETEKLNNYFNKIGHPSDQRKYLKYELKYYKKACETVYFM